jgi:putative transposase
VPWKETCPMDQRVKFIAAVNAFDGSFRALCREFGIAPRTGYKWVARYEQCGPAGLEDRPPIAKRMPHATHADVLARVIDLRKEHPPSLPTCVRQLPRPSLV